MSSSQSTYTLRKLAPTKKTFSIAKFTTKVDFSKFNHPVKLRRKTTQDDELELAETENEKKEEKEVKKEEKKDEQQPSEKKQEWIMEDAKKRYVFEAKPVKEEQDYALFIMQDKEFRMLPLTDEWFTFKPRVFGKLLDTDKAEKQMRLKEESMAKQWRAIVKTEPVVMKKVKEEKDTSREDLDYTETVSDDEGLIEEDFVHAEYESEPETDSDEDDSKLDEAGKAMRELLKKQKQTPGEKKKEKVVEKQPVEKKKRVKKKSPKPEKVSPQQEVKSPVEAKETKKEEKKRKASPQPSTEEPPAKKPKPEEDDMKAQVIATLREKQKMTIKDLMAIFVNVAKTKEEKKARYTKFAAILKEVATIEKGKTKYVVLKKNIA